VLSSNANYENKIKLHITICVPKWKSMAPDKFGFTYITAPALQSSVMGNVYQLQHCC
jgi:hypothetical protein